MLIRPSTILEIPSGLADAYGDYNGVVAGNASRGLAVGRAEASNAEAVNYTLGPWEELTVFTNDGSVPVDNNASEREMKGVVLKRKNSLFVGNPRGGRTAAILASLTNSCRRHDMDPQLYLQLLMNLPSWPRVTSTLGFSIAGSKLMKPGVRLWASRLSIPDPVLTYCRRSLERLRRKYSIGLEPGATTPVSDPGVV